MFERSSIRNPLTAIRGRFRAAASWLRRPLFATDTATIERRRQRAKVGVCRAKVFMLSSFAVLLGLVGFLFCLIGERVLRLSGRASKAADDLYPKSLA